MKGITTWILIGIWGLSGVFAQREVSILDHKDRIRIHKMDILNSPERETNISISPDGRYLFFCSFRGGQFWSRHYMYFKSQPVWDGDIWYSEKVNGNWREPRPMQYGINTSSGEDEPNISADGRTVYYQSWLPEGMWRATGGPYYASRRNGKYWGRPEGLGGGITEFFHYYNATDGMTISPDEKTFIVAAGHDYEMTEKMDLYISRKEGGTWSYCEPLAINTPENERSAFMAGDGKTLYFASDGYKGYGGMDIFKTTLRENGTFGPVVNIGKPFNTPADDYGFILTRDGNEAYFLRNGDIYFADLREADERIKPGSAPPNSEVKITLSGLVKSRDRWENLPAQIVVMDRDTGMPLKSIKTTERGTYQMNLPNKPKNLLLIASCKGYVKTTRDLKLSPQYSDHTYQVNFLLPPVEEKEEVLPPEPEEKPAPVVAEKEEEKPPKKIELSPPPSPKEEKPRPKPKAEEDIFDFSNIAPNHLVLLLDVSSSMNEENRLPLLKESLGELLELLREQDRISIVVYSGDVKTLVEDASAKEGEQILSLIGSIKSGGSTLGQAGLKTAYRVALKNFIENGNNRIIMATDGEFSIKSLIPMAAKNAKRRISLSVFAFGKNKQELKDLARNGKGFYTRITPDNIEAALLREARAVRTN